MRIGHITFCLLATLLMSLPAIGQAADKPDELAGTGYFRDQDTLPGSFRFYQQLPGGEAGLWGLGPTRKKISRASFNADAHADVADYSPQTRCQKCHAPETRDLHGLRMNITCVQCHRNVPVTGILHYYSPLNPIRRHAYVYYGIWFMLILAGGVFVIFLPYTALWWIRDLFAKLTGKLRHD
jgi:hypothetical protein